MFDIDVCVRDVRVCARGCQRPCGCVCFVCTCAPDFAACKPENTDVPSASVVRHVSPTWLSARWESDWYRKDDPSAIESPILIRSVLSIGGDSTAQFKWS